MVLHFFSVSKYTNLSFYFFITKNYPNHFFVFHGKYNKKVFDAIDSSNSIYLTSTFKFLFSKQIRNLIEKSSKIIIHSFTTKESLLSFFNRKLYKKGRVLFIGGDIYCYDNILNKKASKIEILKFKFKRYILKKYEHFSCLSGDYNYAHKYYGIKGDNIRAPYPLIADYKLLRDIYNNMTPTKETRILLGNSATKTNCHIELLDKLKSFKNENVKIIAPLSYGDGAYRDEVIAYGKSIFSEKFIPITNFLDLKSYYQLLSSIDIACFNNNRQQAMGNIQIAAYFGKKIYMRSSTSMWNHFCNEGVFIYDISLIDKEDFIHFKLINGRDANSNHMYFDKMFDTEYLKKLWSKMF